jgi:hypothetical protein
VGDTTRAASRTDGIPVSSELEEQSGARFTGLYLVGQGGLVELRYQVIDASKARNLGQYAETSLHLIVEDSGESIETVWVGRSRTCAAGCMTRRTTGYREPPSGWRQQQIIV